MKRLLYLTDLKGCPFPEEDEFFIPIVSKEYELIVAHPLGCWPHLSSVDGVIMRNTWPFEAYVEELRRLMAFLAASGIPTHNPLTGKGDTQGKRYLVDLYGAGFPVPPTIDDIDKIDQLPESKWYMVKKKFAGNGVGARKMAREELFTADLNEHIIQPFLTFSCEPSFFFIDNKFTYAITMTHRLVEADITTLEPSPEDLAFAQKFIDWNGMSHGVQRVDAFRFADGSLQLGELEDWNQYLYFLDLDEATRARAVDGVLASIRAVFSRGNSNTSRVYSEPWLT